jgi:hypothetical protein
MPDQLHHLMTTAADRVRVGPPPDLADLDVETSGMRRGRWFPAIAAMAGVVAVILGLTQGLPNLREHSRPAAAPRSFALKCDGGQEQFWSAPFDPDPPRDETPESIASSYADAARGEKAVITSQDATSATGFVLRGDGSAWIQVQMIHSDSGGWQTDAVEACNDRPALPRFGG